MINRNAWFWKKTLESVKSVLAGFTHWFADVVAVGKFRVEDDVKVFDLSCHIFTGKKNLTEGGLMR